MHCYEGRSRTAAVSAAYAARHLGIPGREALDRVVAALPYGDPNPEFRALLARM